MERKDFTDDEWKDLQFGPFWAFMAVAAQDGKLDQYEKDAFVVAMSDTEMVAGALGRDVITSIAGGMDQVFTAWEADNRSPADGFAAIRKVLAKVDADEANRYKGLLVWLAVVVANASGGGHGSKVSGRERTGVEEVAELLAFNVAEALAAADDPTDLDSLPR